MNAETMVEIVQGLMLVEKNTGNSGPFALIVPSKYEGMLEREYIETAPMMGTLRKRLLGIEGIEQIDISSTAVGFSLRKI